MEHRASSLLGGDEFGVPARIFGVVDERFYAAVGRVSMLAALMEERLYDMLNSFYFVPQTDHGGKAGTSLTKEIRKLLPRLPEARQGDTYSLRGTVAQLLDDADAALDGRHEIVHSVWPNPSFDGAFSWRSLPKSKRDESGAVTWTRTTSREAFEVVIPEMVRIIDLIGRLLSQIDFEKVQRRDQQ